MTPLEHARTLLEGVSMRRNDRLSAGNIGEWQTEINELARVLWDFLAHLEQQPDEPDQLLKTAPPWFEAEGE
jgi:hypothetical protein